MNEIDKIVDAALAEARHMPKTATVRVPAKENVDPVEVASELEKLAFELETTASRSESEASSLEKRAAEYKHDQIMKLAKIAVILDTVAMLEKSGATVTETIAHRVGSKLRDIGKYEIGLGGIKGLVKGLSGKTTPTMRKELLLKTQKNLGSNLDEALRRRGITAELAGTKAENALKTDVLRGAQKQQMGSDKGFFAKHKTPILIGGGALAAAYLGSRRGKDNNAQPQHRRQMAGAY